MKVGVFDVEGNGFTRDVTDVHCIVIENLEDRVIKRFHDYWALPSEGSLVEGKEELESYDVLVGHNIGSYDLGVLERLLGANFEGTVIIDTMLLSCMLYPKMRKNSLEAWGLKLNLEESKIQINDFSVLTEKLLIRCVFDVKMNTHIYLHLLAKVQELQRKHSDVLDIGKALDLEVKVARIHEKQVIHGIFYDIRLAEMLLDQWDRELNRLRTKIVEDAPRKTKQVGATVQSVYLKQSKAQEKRKEPLRHTKRVLEWFEGYRFGDYISGKPQIDTVKGPFSKVEFVPLNLNSPEQVKEYLLTLGWVPTEWNYKKDKDGKFVYDPKTRKRIKTTPKLTEDSYESLPPGLGEDIASYNVLKHRRSLLQSIKDPDEGSLPLARREVNEDGLGNVAADAFTCGTNTARYAHIKPVANLPSVDARYGRESRRIYRAPYGAFQVGVDLSGIEARKLSDLCFPYPGGPEFAEMVLEGDWHSHNAALWNVPRRIAKIILYAMMYGAGDAKLGKEAGGNAARGEAIRMAFFEGNPAYADLLADLEAAYAHNGGWIPSCDGRPMYPASKKDILNTKIQGDSAVVFKNWMIKCDSLIDIQQGFANQMVAYHDELQFAYYGMTEEFHPECFGQKVCEAALLTGQEMGISVPIAAEYKVGYTYEDCH